MLVLAHRGYHAELPENTLAAFAAALEQGADGVETDIQVTREGTPVLFHDRLIQGKEISALTPAELAARAGYEVPTLVDALEAFPEIFWNLEIKMPTDSAPIFPILRRYRDQRRLLVSSFWHPLAIRVRRELDIAGGLLVAHRPASLGSLLSGVPTERLAIVWDFEGMDRELLDEATSRGVGNYVYGAQTIADHSGLIDGNLAGVITDHPAWVPKLPR